MIHAEIDGLPSDNPEEILNHVYQKFLPDIEDSSEVEKEFKKLIEQSIYSLFAKLFDLIHNINQITK